MAFVITMAGMSSRFRTAGYMVPKYALPVGATSMFWASVSSFEKYFKTDRFIFAVRSDGFAKQFVQSEALKLGISDYVVREIAGDTAGQAETLSLVLQYENGG